MTLISKAKGIFNDLQLANSHFKLLLKTAPDTENTWYG